jgi:hypothetical protein
MTELILELRGVTVKGVRYPVATVSENPGAGGLGLERNGPKWVGGRAAQGEVLTSGPRIKVPAKNSARISDRRANSTDRLPSLVAL